MAYIPNLTALPLHEILLDNGYTYNKNKTSKNNPCLKHENEEGSLVVFKNQNKDGSISYTYKETHTDKVGNIITFCKDRNISVEDLIAGKLEDYLNKQDNLKARNNTQENNEEVQKIREEFNNLKPYDLENATLIKKREIDVKLLEPYKEHLKTDSFNNLILATYLAFEDKRLNVIPIHQYGINKRLNTPLTTDKEGNIRDKPLKSIAQGNKGIEVLYPYLRQEEQWQELVRQGKANDDFKSVVVETYTDIIKNYQREKNTPIYNKRVEKTREFRKPQPVNQPQESFNVVLAFDNDVKGKGYREKCEGILYALLQQFPTIYTPFSKDCNDDLKLAHIIENKAINIDIMAEFLDGSLEKLKDNYTSIQEKENIMDKLEQIDRLKPFSKEFKDILENIKENLQTQSYVKGRGR
ncbi:hypothetical protein KVM11_03470 [Helicobacter pylori]|nr:hypothetical protein KVM11_03470 [Helicobacter pylori]